MGRTVTRVAIPGPAGRIEGLLHRPDVPAPFASVVSHPHPLFGGTMDNKVVYRIARALEELGSLVLRYNFRGAGGSEGVHDRGVGEQDDLRAAMAYLRSEMTPALPMLLAGFSFGSVVSTKVACADAGVAGLLLVGMPLRSYAFDELRDCALPIAVVQGAKDEHGPVPSIQALVASMSKPAALRVVAGAGHFFDEDQGALGNAVKELVAGGKLGVRPVSAGAGIS